MIKILNAPDQLVVGDFVQLYVEPEQEVTWLLSDDRIASLSSNGYLEVFGIGTIKVTAVTSDGESDEVLIDIVRALQIRRLTIDPTRVTLTTGQTFPLALNVVPEGASLLGVQWESSHIDVVDIDGTIITALKPGTSVISATAPNGATSECRVEVLRFEDENANDECDLTLVPVDKSWLTTDRIYAQYRPYPKAVKWFNITRKIGKSVHDTIEIIRKLYCIDTNVGAQLDIIGRILGVSRSFIYQAEVVQSSFAPDGQGAEFGDIDAMFASGAIDTDGNMGDDLYRLVLKAKVVRNNRGATYDDILRTFSILIPQLTNVFIVDFEDMSYEITYVAELTNLQRWALLNVKLLPKPAGVKFRGFRGLPSDYVQAGDESYLLGDEKAQLAGATIDYGD